MATKQTTPAKRYKKAAARKRLDFNRVRYYYEEIKQAERVKREHPNYIRQTAWAHFKAHSPGCWEFWRHGFYYSYRHRLSKGADYTCIPGYDELAQTMATLFPEFASDDGTERLWEFLLSPYDKLPTAEKCYRKALEYAERERKAAKKSAGGAAFHSVSVAEIPF